jgi:hypothetical protein
LDLVNAHPFFVSKRHPDLVNLKEYVDNREKILADTHPDRRIAKQLYLRLLYGGSAGAWSKSNGRAPIPAFAQLYEQDMTEARRRDVASVPEDEMVKIRETSARVGEFIQYMLNTTEERTAIDEICAMTTRAGGEILSYEHDGLFIYFEGNCNQLKQDINDAIGLSVTIVPVKDVASAVQHAKDEIVRQSPAFAPFVNRKDPNWREHFDLIRRARVEKLGSHSLFAAVVLRSPMISSEIPYSVRDLVKLLPTAERYTWYNPKTHCWAQGGSAGEDVLKVFIAHICRRDLSSYTLIKQTDGGIDVSGTSGRWDVTNESFKTGVARALRSELIVPEDFHLDPETSLRYLNFQGRVLDCVTMEWLPMSPDLLISRSTGWNFETPSWWNTPAIETLEAALVAVRRREDERGLGQPSDYDDELIALLEAAAQAIPELAFWHVFTRDCWESTLFELKHMVKAVFGLRIASALWTRGPGRNGKDTVCNIMCKLLGTYACTIAAEALTHIRDPNAPSPVFALCRARRFVAIREVDSAVAFQLQVYKRFTDPLSTLSGRDLYEKLVHYRPQYLAFFASNNPPPMAADLAVRERTSIVEHVCVFRDSVVEVNDAQWVDVESTITETRPGHFALLLLIFKHLMKDRPMRSVAPVPQKCLELLRMELKDPIDDVVDEFITRCSSVDRPLSATDASKVDEALLAFARVKGLGAVRMNASNLLKQKGFGVHRAKRPQGGGRRGYVNVYTYKFVVDGTKAEHASFVSYAD